MKYRALVNGDMQFGVGASGFYINEPNAVAQSVLTRLRLWRGTWFLDENEGVPYIGGVVGRQSLASAEGVIRRAILKTEGVTSIESMSITLDPDERSYKVEATINTIYGTTTFNEAL